MCTLIFCIQPQLLMPIIQYVLPSKSKPIKKLLHFYWEICPKYDENGKLKQEMILVWWVVKVVRAESVEVDRMSGLGARRKGWTTGGRLSWLESEESETCP